MISFIVPVYNAEQYLNACIESLLHQTEQDIELVLVDDGSTDGSLALAKSIAAAHPNVELYEQSHAGQSAARNTGMAHATGEYIAFVDADDYLEPDWCARHMAAIEGVDYVQSGYIRGGKAHTPCHPYRYTTPWMRLYRRQAIEGMQFTEGMIYEDVVFSVDLWLSGAGCRMIAYNGYHYTVNPDSTTSQRRPEAEQRVMHALRKRLHSAPWGKKWIVLYTLLRLKIHFLKQ